MSLADELRQQLDKLKPKPEQIYSIHNKIRNLTNKFDAPGPEMRDVLDFEITAPKNDDDKADDQAAIPPVPVRLYVPQGASETSGPCLVYLHGGGFVTCSLDSHEGLCLRMAETAQMRILSVDYRLAPQYAFPAGPDDCEMVLQWALSGQGAVHGIDATRLAIGGDSAGGNMAAYLAQKYRDDLIAQILFYPLLQLAEIEPVNPGPQDMLRLGVMALNFILKHYVVDADVQNTRLSPLFEDDLKAAPPAYILTCGLDPLRVEGRLYVDKLRANGVRVMHVHEKALPHGFLNFSKAFSKGISVSEQSGEFLKKRLMTSLKP